MQANIEEKKSNYRRFLDEARALSVVDHPRIPKLKEHGFDRDGEPYIVTQYVSGISLVDARSKGRFPEEVSAYIIVEALDALVGIHSVTTKGENADMRHRDISPHNIMLSFDGDVYIIDLGLAASTLKTEHTETNVVLGKQAYMAPEQSSKRDSQFSDQYAMGVVLYEMLSGLRYDDDVDPRKRPMVIATGGHVPAGLANVRADLQAIIRRAIQMNPLDRFESSAAMRDELRKTLSAAPEALRVTAAEMARAVAPGKFKEETALLSDTRIPQPVSVNVFEPPTGEASEATEAIFLLLCVVGLSAVVVYMLWPSPQDGKRIVEMVPPHQVEKSAPGAPKITTDIEEPRAEKTPTPIAKKTSKKVWKKAKKTKKTVPFTATKETLADNTPIPDEVSPPMKVDPIKTPPPKPVIEPAIYKGVQLMKVCRQPCTAHWRKFSAQGVAGELKNVAGRNLWNRCLAACKDK